MSWASHDWLESNDEATQEKVLRALDELRLERGETFWAVLEIISRADPEGLLKMGAPPDEYEPEARTIYPRLSEARSTQDVRRILDEEFKQWFSAGQSVHGEQWVDEDYQIANQSTDLDTLATAIWRFWINQQ